MSDQDPPRLVVTNSDADLERQRADRDREWAERDVDWALRQLAANLMRVVRGAGKPNEIAEHAQAFIQALVKYRDAAGHLDVINVFPAMLSFGTRELHASRLTGAHLDAAYAEEQAVRGALQVAASRLLGQSTQRSAGSGELSDGARRLMKAYADQRLEWERKAKAAAKPTTSNKPRRQAPARAKTKE